MSDISRSAMVDWMETHGCAKVTERPMLNWARIDAYVVDQHDGYISGTAKGFHLFEAALAGHQRAEYDAKLEPGLPSVIEAVPGTVQCQVEGERTVVDMEGHVTLLQVLIDDSIFREVWSALMPGDPDNFESWTMLGVFDDRMRRISQALLDEMRMPSLGGELYAETLVQQLAILILRRQQTLGTQQRMAHALSDHDVARVIDHMHASMEDPGGLDTFAQLIGTDTYNFSRGFKAKTGMPPHQFLTSLRISAAKDSLAHSEDTLADIAYGTGFSSQSHMTTVFRKLTGLSPGEYRKRAKS